MTCECGQDGWHFAKCRELHGVLEGRQIESMHWVYRQSGEFYRER